MPESREARGVVRRIYANLGLLVGGKAGAGLISLLYLVIAARALGPRDYGVLMLVHAYAMAVGGIVGFPGWHAIVRYGAHATRAGDQGRLVRLLRFAGGIETIGGVAAILVAAGLAPLIGPRLGWSAQAQALALPYSFAVLASMRATPAGYLQLIGRFDLLGIHNMVAPGVRLAGAAVAALAGAGLRGFLLAWLVAALAEWIAMWALGIWMARRTLDPGTRLVGSPAGAVAENAGIWRFMLGANADVTFGELAGRIVPLMVGWVLGPVAAGLFSVAQRATIVIQQPAQILGQAAYAEFARLVAAGGGGRAIRQTLARCVGSAVAMAVPVVIAMSLFGRPLAMLLGGPGFAAAALLIPWLSVARLALVVAPPVSAALVALGRPGWSVASNLGVSLALLPLLPLAMLRFGLVGAGIQAVVQAIAVAGVLAMMLLRATARRVPPLPRAAAA